MSKLNELIEAQKTFKAKIEELGKAAIAEELQALFAKHENLEAVRWNQYTPYFNDGDACTFGVGDVTYKATDGDPEGGDYEDGFEYAWSRDSSPLISDVASFGSKLHNLDDAVLLMAFGDHKTITATRDGVEVEEYEHD
jgi:hypothetical protein